MTTVLVDADIPCHSIAHASMNRHYIVPYNHDIRMFKYKKDAKAFCLAKGVALEDIIPDIAPEPLENCLYAAKHFLRSLVKRTGASDYRVFLSGSSNFRQSIYPDYKANRKDMEKPLYHSEIREYFIKNHDAEVFEGIEADDALGIAQCETFEVSSPTLGKYLQVSKERASTIIASTDKDMRLIPGWNYNWTKDSLDFIPEDEANLNFWCQMLSGDRADNIITFKGYPDKPPWTKAKALLEGRDWDEMKELVYKEYIKNKLSKKEFDLNWKLLWILREPKEGS